MSWDFETDPEFQKELDWIDLFVKEEVEPLDHVLGFPYEVKNPKRNIPLSLILGTGTMGQGIAQITAAAGFLTRIHDIAPERVS